MTLLRIVRLIVYLAIAVVCLAGCGRSQSSAAAVPAGDYVATIFAKYPDLKSKQMLVATVKRVVDGDTFQLASGEKVRLIGVNTPETVKPNSPVEYFGKEASDYAKKQLTGRKVILFKDVSEKDKYGRLLRYVFIDGESTMFNETLVRDGYANVMTIPPDVMYAKTFVKLEKEAREANRGLWNKK